MTHLHDRIKSVIRNANAVLTAEEISANLAVGCVGEVKEALLEMQDSGDVLLRNGFYRLSAREALEPWEKNMSGKSAAQ